MSSYILAVFEGEKTEKDIFDNLQQYLLNENINTILYGFHCGEIYSLYNKMKSDEYLDLFMLLKENLSDKNINLENIDKDDVIEMYLFFDYDGHASSATDDKLFEMLQLFNNETENGKLYISYPMVEAIKHLPKIGTFKDLKASSDKQYKETVQENGKKDYQNLHTLTKEDWHIIIEENCKKANFIVNNTHVFPQQEIAQISIFNKQVKGSNLFREVFVLSSFPMFVADYYGYSNMTNIMDRLSLSI